MTVIVIANGKQKLPKAGYIFWDIFLLLGKIARKTFKRTTKSKKILHYMGHCGGKFSSSYTFGRWSQTMAWGGGGQTWASTQAIRGGSTFYLSGGVGFGGGRVKVGF